MERRKIGDLKTSEELKQFALDQFDIVKLILDTTQDFMPQLNFIYQCPLCQAPTITLMTLRGTIDELRVSISDGTLKNLFYSKTVQCDNCNQQTELVAYIFVILANIRQLPPKELLMIYAKNISDHRFVFYRETRHIDGKLVGLEQETHDISERSIVNTDIFGLYP